MSVGHALLARFDSARLRAVVLPAPRTEPVDAAGTQAVRDVLAWCHRGAGPEQRNFWRPGSLPRVDRRLAVALIGSKQAVDEACLQIDGSGLLQDCGNAAARLALRLRVKCHDAMWWRARAPIDPWDSGYAISPAALAGFEPRRATLIVVDVDVDSIDAALRAVAALHARQARLAHAVRVLIVSPLADTHWAGAWRDGQQTLPDWTAVSRLG